MSRRKPSKKSRPFTAQPAAKPVQSSAIGKTRERVLLALFWSYVLVPLAWGIKSTVEKALLLFR